MYTIGLKDLYTIVREMKKKKECALNMVSGTVTGDWKKSKYSRLISHLKAVCHQVGAVTRETNEEARDDEQLGRAKAGMKRPRYMQSVAGFKGLHNIRDWLKSKISKIKGQSQPGQFRFRLSKDDSDVADMFYRKAQDHHSPPGLNDGVPAVQDTASSVLLKLESYLQLDRFPKTHALLVGNGDMRFKEPTRTEPAPTEPEAQSPKSGFPRGWTAATIYLTDKPRNGHVDRPATSRYFKYNVAKPRQAPRSAGSSISAGPSPVSSADGPGPPILHQPQAPPVQVPPAPVPPEAAVVPPVPGQQAQGGLQEVKLPGSNGNARRAVIKVEDIQEIWQEIGRCGRDGEQASAVVFHGKGDLKNAKEVKAFLTSDGCLRKELLKHLGQNTHTQQEQCCSHCDRAEDTVSTCLFSNQAREPCQQQTRQKRRRTTPDTRKSEELKKRIEELREEWYAERPELLLYGSYAVMADETIKLICGKCKTIHCVEDFEKISGIPVGKAGEILDAIDTLYPEYQPTRRVTLYRQKHAWEINSRREVGSDMSAADVMTMANFGRSSGAAKPTSTSAKRRKNRRLGESETNNLYENLNKKMVTLQATHQGCTQWCTFLLNLLIHVISIKQLCTFNVASGKKSGTSFKTQQPNWPPKFLPFAAFVEKKKAIPSSVTTVDQL
uniref:Uncharacterized protein n=1 Tax=Branchiostoma floridae TaxID=7739 RepID=C3Z184_BRAFL|eukprot:XP_002597771.1 hypothetical protein BRAFLDRAFT_77326 [Branchiostoma floridae]